MDKVINQFKSTGCWALFLSFTAITAVEFSYVSGGLRWLDALVFLLIPAFILLFIQLVLTCHYGGKGYWIAFAIVIACITFSFIHLSNIEVGTIDDNYHDQKIVALSIKNSFFTQFQYPNSGVQFYISDFVESIWGIFWRWTQWDFIIIILQALPIVLLWQQLIVFFQKQKVKAYAGLLATVVVMTLEILWCQQGSGFIDSTVGMFIGINLLLCYNFMSSPHERRFSYLAGLVFVSGLCLVSKPTGICISILGMTIAFVLGFRYLDTLQKILLPFVALPALIYFFYHQMQVQILKGNFFYPYVSAGSSLHFFSYPYYKIPIHLHFSVWVEHLALHFKPLYVLLSWLADYKRESDISPAPFIRGNGLVFTYIVIPTLILWIFQHRDVFKTKLWKDPRLFIFAVIFIFYCFFEGSTEARFALGYNIFILSWCLSYLWQYWEQSRFNWFKRCSPAIICLLLLMSACSYDDGIRGPYLEIHKISPLAIQKRIFPQPYDTQMRIDLIQKLSE